MVLLTTLYSLEGILQCHHNYDTINIDSIPLPQLVVYHPLVTVEISPSVTLPIPPSRGVSDAVVVGGVVPVILLLLAVLLAIALFLLWKRRKMSKPELPPVNSNIYLHSSPTHSGIYMHLAICVLCHYA